jgi:predicted RNA binding protein with dsRBD fold (UPF0201 family)
MKGGVMTKAMQNVRNEYQAKIEALENTVALLCAQGVGISDARLRDVLRQRTELRDAMRDAMAKQETWENALKGGIK